MTMRKARVVVIVDFKPSGVEISLTKKTSVIDRLRWNGHLNEINLSTHQKGALSTLLKNLGIISR